MEKLIRSIWFCLCLGARLWGRVFGWVVLASLLVAWLFFGHRFSLSRAAIVEFSWTALAIIVLVTLLIIFFMIFHQLRLEHDALKGVIDYEAAVNELSELFDKGNNAILNGQVASEGEYRTWRAAWHTWHGQVQDLLVSKFAVSERNLFSNLVLVPQHNLMGFNESHARERAIVAEQLAVLRSIIVRHSDRAIKRREVIK